MFDEILSWLYDQAIATAHYIPLRISDFLCIGFSVLDCISGGDAQRDEFERDQDFDRLLAGNEDRLS